MNKILSLLFFTGLSLNLLGQKYAFVTYSTEQGLPQTQVTAITQDSMGYLWVGTLGGLAKFNGASFTTYSSNNGLLNNRITTLSYFEGTIWVGHDGGISFIRNEKITRIPFQGNDKSRNVSAILRFGKELIVTSNGGGLFRLENNQLVHVNIGNADSDRIRGAYVADNKLYLATRAGVLVSDDARHFKLFDDLPDYNFSGIIGNDNYRFYSTYSDGLYRYSEQSGKYVHYSAESLRHNVFGCYVDKASTVWLITEEGIVYIKENGMISFLNEKNGLPVDMISAFFEDKDGNLWIGSSGKGIFRFPGVNFTFLDQSTGLLSDLFVCGFQKRNGDYYLGTFDKGIILKKSSGEVSRLDTRENTIWAALENVNGRDWFGTQSSLVAVKPDGKIEVYDIEDGLPGIKVTALYKISDNEMYVGGSEGVSFYNGRTFQKIGNEESEYIGTVRDFVQLNDSLYCVTNLGVFVLRNRDFKLLNGISQVVYNIEKDKNGNLWYGTEEGLYRIKGNKIDRIFLLEDPASNYINFLNYHKGEMYVGTNNGLFILSDLDEQKVAVQRFGIGEGVVDLETNLNSGFFDRHDNFWFGTASGLIAFHPGEGKGNTSAPILNLKSIKLNYQPFDYSLYADELHPSGLPVSLTLPYSKNNLIFELDGVSLVHHRGLRYQFLLEGMNDEWSPLTEVASITFTSLPAGEYKLFMRSVDIDGRISKELVFPFVIKQAFYKTWWFIGIMTLFLALIVWRTFRLRLRRIRELNEKEKLEYKTKLLALEQKSVNASMNRHFIFNALNSIQYFINTQDRVSANKYLTNFAQLIRKNLDSANADSNTITLEEELSRIRLYLSLESMRFKDCFDYEINIDGVDTESIMIPAMIMQPFVENSIIHGILPNEGKFGQIRIRVFPDENYLNILIEDNGIGINQSLSKKTIMDGDHRSQGMEITSKRIELMKKISDKNIELIGPDEVVNNDGSINGTRVLIKIPLSDLEN